MSATAARAECTIEFMRSLRSNSRSLLIGVVFAALAADAASAAPLRVARTAQLPTPPGVCGGVADASTPTVDADPAGRTVVASLLLRGGRAASLARSDNGGRSFTATVLPGLSVCSGAAADHGMLVNPRGALGPDGRAWYGSSWFGNDAGLFDFGVEVAAAGDGIARPAGHAQDVAVLPDQAGSAARALWTSFDQVPNPATYLPTRTRLLTASVRPDGDLGPVTTALDPGAGTLLDDPSLLRGDDDTLIAVANTATYGDLVGTFNPASASEPVRFVGVSTRSTDGGATWTRGGMAGSPILAEFSRDGVRMLIGGAATAAGPGRIVRAITEEPRNGRGGIALTESRDAGRTWSSQRRLIDVPVVAFMPAVAVLPGGRVALSWFDARGDRAGDGRLDVRPWAAVVDLASGTREEVPLGPAFDLGPLMTPSYAVDGSALGVSQDLVALPAGFGTVHTEPAAAPATTRVVYSRLSTKAKDRRAPRRAKHR